MLAETNPVTGTVPWTDLKVKFNVPASDCQAQWLKLIIPARTASESEIEGEAWFKSFRVTAEVHPITDNATNRKEYREVLIDKER